jgi:hypothetical protein
MMMKYFFGFSVLSSPMSQMLSAIAMSRLCQLLLMYCKYTMSGNAIE